MAGGSWIHHRHQAGGADEIVALVGAGGMGEVYRARDTRLDRTVAIRVLPALLAADPQLRERFTREARAISSLSHPNICTLFDVGHHEGSPLPRHRIPRRRNARPSGWPAAIVSL